MKNKGELLKYKEERRDVPDHNPDNIEDCHILDCENGIAVTGIACRFPGAKNYEEFWENLKQGKAGIREIPSERWDWRNYWGDPQTQKNKTNSKWGGFISDVETFDLNFFGITVKEVETMDPQQRIMLELAWSCFEDAGVCPSHLSGEKVGVFLGAANLDYKELQEAGSRPVEAHYASGIAHSVIANRISYFFNLKGPSFLIDTACSSSLTAIHSAVQSMLKGECNMALAGGVSLLLTPRRFISFSKLGILSPTGSCKTFDDSADGIVRGEGAGVMLLKPLGKAIRDRDNIYGIIKGSAINHSGKTYTLTYPNADAQAEVIKEAYNRAGIKSDSISYIEAHGTGTPKGDPIEIEGLLKAFKSTASREDGNLQNYYCGLGSVKTNVGHLEAAAGAVGIIKVLLSMKYKQIPGLQNFSKLNHRINIKDSPFYIVENLKEWEPRETENGTLLRRAGVSAFGFAGTNAHVVIEEPPVINKTLSNKPESNIICISARTKEALRQREEDLLIWLEKETTGNSIYDISATLLLGREHFAVRSAFVVKDTTELQDKLKQVLSGEEPEGYFIKTDPGKGKKMSPLFIEFGKTILKELQSNKKINSEDYKNKVMALAELYVEGCDYDWNIIYPAERINRVNLPTYPFAKERCWLSDEGRLCAEEAGGISHHAAHIHPLLHRNTSDLTEQRFSSRFKGNELFLDNYVLKGQKTFPVTAYLEMACASVEQSAGILKGDKRCLSLENVVWGETIKVMDNEFEVHAALEANKSGRITVEIYSENEDKSAEPDIFMQTEALYTQESKEYNPDLKEIKARCNKDVVSGSSCYEALSNMGLYYGAAYKSVTEIHIGEKEALAKLSLPEWPEDNPEGFLLHPVFSDAVLQVFAGLRLSCGDQKLPVPLRMKSMKIWGKCTSEMWAFIRLTDNSDGKYRVDADLLDDEGNVYARFKSLELTCKDAADTIIDTVEVVEPKEKEQSSEKDNINAEAFTKASINKLREFISEITGVQATKLDIEAGFDELGLDSITIPHLNKRIEAWVGVLDATLFFKFSNIQDLGKYLAEKYPERLPVTLNELPAVKNASGKTTAVPAKTQKLKSIRWGKFSGRSLNISGPEMYDNMDIAVIGISGKFPKASTLGQFWKNLYEGRDCIEEIPEGRWPMGGFFEPDRTTAVAKGISYCKWGGFLENVDCFDPLFFSISPKEAEFMDPQERLFLQTAWECFEDAGYTRKTLESMERGNQVGVFVGATFNNYQLFMAESAMRSNREFYAANSQIYSIANRVSYIMNLTGPSLTVDTACSSSLYAAHMACESIRTGQSLMAVAGGVNLSIHPSKHVLISKDQFGATDGRCRAFCEGGTGYVPSEAVGAILLKPLKRALEDGDHIYGVIKGTAANHGGRTNGYTVPNPVSQSRVIEEALSKSHIDPRTISFIEAHGTGTELGDPIEITGLTDAFRKYTQDTGYCSISSVKSNMGHAEAAAGIAQLVKVLLQLKYATLVKNVMHGNGLNPNIDFAATPFVVQEKTEHWKRPVIDGQEFPRRAGVTSVGAGGTNAHVVLEEYIPEKTEQAEEVQDNAPSSIIILSARNEDRLRELVKSYLVYIDEEPFKDSDLANMAYTLQVGREAMPERIAVKVKSVKDLYEKLSLYLEGNENIPDLYRGQVKNNKAVISNFGTGEDISNTIAELMEAGNYGKLAEHWTKGLPVQWEGLYGDTRPCRISLPTYQFAKERYWVAENRAMSGEDGNKDIGSLGRQRYNSVIISRRYFLKDYKLGGHSVVPAVTRSDVGSILLEPSWKERAAVRSGEKPVYARRIVFLCEMDSVTAEGIQKGMKDAECIALGHMYSEIEKRFEAYSVKIFERLKELLNDKGKGKFLIQVVASRKDEKSIFGGFSGLLETVGLENPKVVCQMIEIESETGSEGILEILEENRCSPSDRRICYKAGRRFIAGWKECRPQQTSEIPWKDGGVYLITGGLGGLGNIFSKEIIRQAGNTILVLTGRSAPDKGKQAKIKELESLGAVVHYRQVDVTNKYEVLELFKYIRENIGSLNGIIHAAGIIRDSFIIRKSREEFLTVLAPKVAGVVNLDMASSDINVDFFIMFSSLAGTLGNPGQIDYSAANAFMDAYAEYRNTLVERKERSGRTISISWPLWKNGGMHIDAEAEKAMYNHTGMTPMQTMTGLKAFYSGLASKNSQVMVMEGEVDLIREKLSHLFKASTLDNAGSEENITAVLTGIVSELLNVRPGDIGADTEFDEYGFEPVTLAEFAGRINALYGLELPHTLFYQYTSIGSFARYLCKEYGTVFEAVSEYTGIRESDMEKVNGDWKGASCGINDAGELTAASSEQGVAVSVNTQELKEKVTYKLKKMFSEISSLDMDRIDIEESLDSYGINSIMIIQLNGMLEGVFEGLSKTIFYEYNSIGELGEYLTSEYTESCMKWTGMEQQAVPENREIQTAVLRVETQQPALSLSSLIKRMRNLKAGRCVKEASEPIAIIGMSGRFPHSGSLKEYWANLEAGRDCITEIPPDRWPLEGFYHPDVNEAVQRGKSYSKWGGFVEGFADFAPLFFNISPREALNMDPQERLFIETCWEALEDAGYTRELLTKLYNGRVGVFAGITKTGYELYGPDLWRQGEQIFPYISFGSAANRISYLFNLHGPSMPVDTMCSSSLTAIHEACEYILRNECEMAIVGGVNLYLHPSNYVFLCSQQMLSKDGRCKSFGRGGNGFVPGEGVGTLILKRLSRAEKDGDHIYAVIKGTSINHGGKTNGFTVPSPVAQGELIRNALERAGVNARAVSYIEAHGTGTELGDPIEITGLSQAFRKDTQDVGFCSIGSVKSNIGHLEAAAGIAGLIKIVLQMKNKKLVPSLHSEKLNPNINFEKTPFFVQQNASYWRRPVFEIDGKTAEFPRIAGISSFGAGGSNAHVVIEEYEGSGNEGESADVTPQNPAIIVLSAKSAGSLKEEAVRLLAFIREQQPEEADLARIAYTLQVGREAMEERMAIVAISLRQLEDALGAFIEGRNNIPDLYIGRVKQNKDIQYILTGDDDMATAVEAMLDKKKYAKVLELWINGISLDWDRLYPNVRPKRISLPTYPFEREKLWVPLVGNLADSSFRQEKADVYIDKNNYAETIDEVLNGEISIEAAAAKIKGF